MTDDLLAGLVIDAAAKLATLVPQRAPTVEAALGYLEATGDTTVADALADRGGVAALPADVAPRIERLAGAWPAFDPGWWPRVEEPVRAVLSGGTVVMSGRLDVLLGGPPTPRPAVVVEIKAGRWHDGARADAHLYALLVALRDGVPPAAVVTVVADGTTQVEPVRPAVLATAADRVVARRRGRRADRRRRARAREPRPALRALPAAAGVPRGPRLAPGRRGAPVRDAVGAADRLTAAVADALTEVLAGAADPVADVYVGWVAAADAADCPARYRAGGEGGWGFPGWSASNAAAAAGRAALDHHLHGGDDDPARPHGDLPAPLEVVRAWIREAAVAGAPGVGGWVGDLRADGDAAALAAAAGLATRWLAGFVRVLGWPLPDRLALLGVLREDGPSGAPRWWPAKGSPVTVACGADARIGRVTGSGDFALVVHRPASADDAEVHRRATFEAAAGALALRVAPDSVLVTAGDTGSAPACWPTRRCCPPAAS